MFEIDKLEPGKQAEMIERISKVIFQGALLRALPSLSDSEQEEFSALTDREAGPEELFGFLEAKIPGFEKILFEEMETFKADAAADLAEAGME